jgi:hypothetical protein
MMFHYEITNASHNTRWIGQQQEQACMAVRMEEKDAAREAAAG